MKSLRRYITTVANYGEHKKHSTLIIAGCILRQTIARTYGDGVYFWTRNFQYDESEFTLPHMCSGHDEAHMDIAGEHIVFQIKRRVKSFDFHSTWQYYKEITRCMYSKRGKRRNMCWVMYDRGVTEVTVKRIACILRCIFKTKRIVTRKFAPYPYGDGTDAYSVFNFAHREYMPVAGLMPHSHIIDCRNFARKNHMHTTLLTYKAIAARSGEMPDDTDEELSVASV